MKLLSSALLALLLMAGGVCNAQWTEVSLPRPETTTPLVALEWPDSATGFVFDLHGRYYKTMDGGETWKVCFFPSLATGDFTLRYTDFRTRDFGIASFEHRDRKGLDSLIYVTTDGGEHWDLRGTQLVNPVYGGAYNDYYSVVRLLPSSGMFQYYATQLSDDPIVGAEVVEYSSDLGNNWRRISADTLKPEDLVTASGFVLVDSLHQYKFYNWRHEEGTDAWVKMTTDGGRSWSRITDPSHPLAAQYFRGFGFKRIHMVNDTGIAITVAPQSDFPPGRNYGLITTDIRNRDSRAGWAAFALPWFGSATIDVAYREGILYAMTSSSAPYGYTDSTWIMEGAAAASAIRSPAYFQNVAAPSKNVLWALSEHNYNLPNKLYRLQKKILSAREPAQPDAGSALVVYPNPVSLNAANSVGVSFGLRQAVRRVAIRVYDLLGRLLLSRSLEDLAPGAYTERLPLSDALVRTVPSSVIVTLRADDNRTQSTILFITK